MMDPPTSVGDPEVGFSPVENELRLIVVAALQIPLKDLLLKLVKTLI